MLIMSVMDFPVLHFSQRHELGRNSFKLATALSVARQTFPIRGKFLCGKRRLFQRNAAVASMNSKQSQSFLKIFPGDLKLSASFH